MRIVMSGVNPTDWKARAPGGLAGPPVADEVTPNHDGAGVVVATGDGVPSSRVGQRVWLWQSQYDRAGGTAAEYVAIDARHAVTLPVGSSFELGAGLGIPAMTAHRCLCAAGPIGPQDAVLVHGGAGAVGHAAIELARWWGARVAATVSSPAKADLARAAGASLVVDYRNEDVASAVRSWAPDGVSRVVEVDLARNLAMDAAVIAPGGTIAVYAATTEPTVPPPALMRQNASIGFVLVYTIPDAAKRSAIDEVTNALTAGVLTPLPAVRFPLARIADAHDAVAGGAIGKVLVDVWPGPGDGPGETTS